jgi:hypothetical protein
MSKLTGQVTVHDQPATTAVVEIHNSEGNVVDQVQVDGEGRYTYHLSAGRWTLRVWDAFGHRGSGEVAMGDDDVALDVALEEPEGGH